MLKAKRANVVLRINDNQQDYYAAKGYTIYDMSGNVIKEQSSNNVELLKKENDKYAKKISELEQEIASLQSENVELKDELARAKSFKEKVEVVEEQVEEKVEKPKKKNK